MSGTIPKRRGATTCSNHKGSCRGQRCGAVWSFSAPSTRWLVRRPMPRISIRANRRRGCLRIVARPVTAARPASPKGAPVPRYSSSCRSITRPVRTRPRSSLLIWPRSIPDEADDRVQTPGRLLGHAGRRSVRPKRCQRRQRIEKIEEFVARRSVSTTPRRSRPRGHHRGPQARNDDEAGELATVVGLEKPVVIPDRDAAVRIALGTEHIRVGQQPRSPG